MNSCQFYRRSAGRAGGPVAPLGYSYTVWKPGLLRVRPHGLPLQPFFIWWIFHQLRVFANRDYAVVLIQHQNQLVHRSVVTPKYFRFPFMGNRDLQVGDTWTHEAHRGKGLATLGLQAALEAGGNREYWYLVEEGNLPSIRVAMKLGFRLAGVGIRTRRLGLALLGSFVLRAPPTTPSETSEVKGI